MSAIEFGDGLPLAEPIEAVVICQENKGGGYFASLLGKLENPYVDWRETIFLRNNGFGQHSVRLEGGKKIYSVVQIPGKEPRDLSQGTRVLIHAAIKEHGWAWRLCEHGGCQDGCYGNSNSGYCKKSGTGIVAATAWHVTYVPNSAEVIPMLPERSRQMVA